MTPFYYVYTHDKDYGTAGIDIWTNTDLDEVCRRIEDANWTDEPENDEDIYKRAIRGEQIRWAMEHDSVFHAAGKTFTVTVMRSAVCNLCERLGDSKPGSTCSMCGRQR